MGLSDTKETKVLFRQSSSFVFFLTYLKREEVSEVSFYEGGDEGWVACQIDPEYESLGE